MTKAPSTVRRYLGLTLLLYSGVSLVFTGIAVSVLSTSALSCVKFLQETSAATTVINEIIAVFVARKGFQWAGELGKADSKRTVSMKQEELKKHNRDMIINATFEEFATEGYHKVNMERICSYHGISKRMMYHYFLSFYEMFLECVRKTFSDLAAYMNKDAGEIRMTEYVDALRDFLMKRENSS